MKKVRITVLKTTFQDEIAEEYGVPGMTPCPLHKAGQEYLADHRKPEGFCDEAWKAIQHFVFACAHMPSTKYFYYENEKGWNKYPGMAIGSCQDGFRPVIFKIETTDIEATRNN
ncbi:MAG: TIGR04076 family protein [Synergistaceae bacterium]|jgi:uncharacterized repeat protein (TIGR04076 family)|nr:TIGR04076 family protein [Synergistaceae bacterium]